MLLLLLLRRTDSARACRSRTSRWEVCLLRLTRLGIGVDKGGVESILQWTEERHD